MVGYYPVVVERHDQLWSESPPNTVLVQAFNFRQIDNLGEMSTFHAVEKVVACWSHGV